MALDYIKEEKGRTKIKRGRMERGLKNPLMSASREMAPLVGARLIREEEEEEGEEEDGMGLAA